MRRASPPRLGKASQWSGRSHQPSQNLRKGRSFGECGRCRNTQTEARNRLKARRPLAWLFPGGVEHHAQTDSELGSVRPVNANDLPTAQKATAFREGRVVDNHCETAHKRGPRFEAAGLLSIPEATPARSCRYR